MAGATQSGLVKVTITGNASTLITEIKRLKAQWESLGITVKKVEEKQTVATKKMSDGFKIIHRHASSVVNVLFTMKTLMGVLAFGALGKSVLDTAIQFNKWDASLSAIVGSAQEVSRVKRKLADQADYLGQRYISLIEQYTKFRAAAEAAGMSLIDIEKTFLAVSKAAAVFQLGARDTYEIFRALTQMISKGTISAEELRGQFGERLPAALSILADALGVSLKKLLQMMELTKLIKYLILQLIITN